MRLGIFQRGKGREWVENGKQRRDGVGPGGFIPRWWTRCVVAWTVTDWAAGRCSLGGVVILVQWCDHEARAHAVPTARRTVSVVVCKNHVAAELSGGSSVQGKGGTTTWLRCLVGSCAAGKERVRARPGTRRTLSASMVRARRGQSMGCRRPMDGVGGNRLLGIVDGGWGLLVVWWQGLACPLHLGRHE
jgi:hypothetical protein